MGKFIVVTITVVMAFVLLTIALVWAFGNQTPSTHVAPLEDIEPDSPLYFEREGIYFVRRGDRVAAVDEDVVFESLDGVVLREDTAVYCVRSGLFEAEWAGKFDWRGRYYGGPAPHGMTTYPVEIRDGRVYVDFSRPQEGLPRSSPATEPFGPFCTPV